jgi:hypothetical protein
MSAPSLTEQFLALTEIERNCEADLKNALLHNEDLSHRLGVISDWYTNELPLSQFPKEALL